MLKAAVMDKNRFGEHSPGQLRPVELAGNDSAFIPDPSPPSFAAALECQAITDDRHQSRIVDWWRY